MALELNIPEKCYRLLWDPLLRRFRVLYGGRGSAKSWSTARFLISQSVSKKLRILCTREIQNSIKDSVYRLLVDQIREMGLNQYFTIKNDSIISNCGSEFLFKGLQKNIDEIKSTEGIDICWVEEAERVSANSWDKLVPTVRKDGSFFIIVFNPEDEKSATLTRFVQKDGVPVNNPEIARAFVNYVDNPFFPKVLTKEMEWDKKNDPDKYQHVWMGKPKKYGNAVIFKNKIVVQEFEAKDGVQFFYGSDFGYAADPTVLLRCYIESNKLWIDYSAYGHGVEIDDLHQFFETVPDSHMWKIKADSSRPETISHLSRPTKDGKYEGFLIEGAKKGKGSVEDGLMFLKSFEAIVIHPRNKGVIEDFNNYRWKKDKITEEILPIPVDKSNHAPDGIRYALEDWVKAGYSLADVL